MRRVKVFVPVILRVLDEDNCQLEQEEDELSIIESDAINEFISGNFTELEGVSDEEQS